MDDGGKTGAAAGDDRNVAAFLDAWISDGIVDRDGGAADGGDRWRWIAFGFPLIGIGPLGAGVLLVRLRLVVDVVDRGCCDGFLRCAANGPRGYNGSSAGLDIFEYARCLNC